MLTFYACLLSLYVLLSSSATDSSVWLLDHTLNSTDVYVPEKRLRKSGKSKPEQIKFNGIFYLMN